MNHRPLLIAASLTLASSFSISSAANINYVGVQYDVEDTTSNTPTAGWRNTTPVKPLDIDGDNILGSDGYDIYFKKASNPSYATIAYPYPNRNNASTALWDNPADPTGNDVTGGFYHDSANALGVLSAPLLSFAITNPLPVGETLRLGVLFDVTSSGTASYTLTQTVGGSSSVTSLVYPFDGLGLDVAFFDISSVSVGDTFTIRATSISGATIEQVAGITFDTGMPVADQTPPTLDTLTSVVPVDGATAVPYYASLQATFSEPIALTGAGSITLKNLSGGADIPINLPGDVSISPTGTVLTIDPPTRMLAEHEYAVEISSDMIEDLTLPPNAYAGLLVTDTPNWSFTINQEPLRIMPMGDSITAGYTDGSYNEPFWYGYRSGLYNRLDSAGYNFVFVGQSPQLPDHLPAGTVPPADLNALQQNAHNGYSGSSVTYLNENILTWLANDDPDIILLKIGTNGLIPQGLDDLVDTITTTKPDCHLIIAQIMPKITYQQPVVDYNTWIRDTLVPTYQALGRKVTHVDQYAPFLTNPADLTSIDPSLFSNGINHPDNVGYDKMAQVWFEEIEALGINSTYTNWIALYPGVGTQTGFAEDPDGDGHVNGLENYFGTAPDSFTQGLVSGAVNTGANTFTFTHPLNASPASDLTATYRWSTDLQNFHGDGVANGADTTTVDFVQGTPSGGMVTVTATITGTVVPERLFVVVEVTQSL